jgi:hypothetical protein
MLFQKFHSFLYNGSMSGFNSAASDFAFAELNIPKQPVVIADLDTESIADNGKQRFQRRSTETFCLV